MNSLKQGKLDKREWIFKEGARNVLKFKNALKKGTVRDLMPDQHKNPYEEDVQDGAWADLVMSLDGPFSEADKLKFDRLRVDKGFWDLLFLYEHHPRGKDTDFYEEICEAICKRRKPRAK